jgi:hypothetical protein
MFEKMKNNLIYAEMVKVLRYHKKWHGMSISTFIYYECGTIC